MISEELPVSHCCAQQFARFPVMSLLCANCSHFFESNYDVTSCKNMMNNLKIIFCMGIFEIAVRDSVNRKFNRNLFDVNLSYTRSQSRIWIFQILNFKSSIWESRNFLGIRNKSPRSSWIKRRFKIPNKLTIKKNLKKSRWSKWESAQSSLEPREISIKICNRKTFLFDLRICTC